jgi:hypothetical protein
MDESSGSGRGKTPHCYHLVTLKSACRLQLFAAGAGGRTGSSGIFFGCGRLLYVLDLFS